MRKRLTGLTLYGIALVMAIMTVVFAWTGLPSNYDTEPLLGIGLFCLALAGLHSIKR